MDEEHADTASRVYSCGARGASFWCAEIRRSVRSLTQPRVLKLAFNAGLITALVCLPRLLLWMKKPMPLWYLGIAIFFSATILWAFVFGWHAQYAKRSVFTWQISGRDWLIATAGGISGAGLWLFFLDPSVQQTNPRDYPADLQHWVARTLFALSLGELFHIFGPFAWAARLVKNHKAATVVPVLLGLLVLWMKTSELSAPISVWLLLALMITRIVSVCFLVMLYLRGGLLLAWWFGFLLEARHLFALW